MWHALLLWFSGPGHSDCATSAALSGNHLAGKARAIDAHS